MTSCWRGPGEKIPVDGVVEEGRSEVDQSFVTGETRPAPVAAGSEVYAGAINLGGALRIRVRHAAAGTLVDEVNALLEKAIEQRSSYVQLADRAARYYAPLVSLASLAAFFGWAAFGASWGEALEVAIAVLIITCPCALGLAVPAVQVVAAGALFRRGVILQGGDALERLAEIDTVAFDKTGTLTLPRPTLINADDASAEELALAGALALSSRHPLAAAVAAAAGAKTPLTAHEFPGQGVTALVAGKRIKLGSIGYCKAEAEAEAVAKAHPDASLIAFRGPERAVVFAASQATRVDAAETIMRLAARGLSVEILSGDRARAVEGLAAELKVAKWSGGLKPADKIARLKALKAEGRKVLMVGDGLNDAPALAAARRLHFADLGGAFDAGAGRRGLPRGPARPRRRRAGARAKGQAADDREPLAFCDLQRDRGPARASRTGDAARRGGGDVGVVDTRHAQRVARAWRASV